jgi:8-oxo-dGTP diphosphatase
VRKVPAETTVVGVAIVDDGRLLAARRRRPPALAGRWELPGGKVEGDEEIAEAAVREVAEELGCIVGVTGEIPLSVPIAEGLVLRVAVASLHDGEPVPHEHDAVRWLAADALDDVDWLEPDRPFLPLLAAVLRGGCRQPPELSAPDA